MSKGAKTLAENIAKLEAADEEVKAAVREAHEVIQTVRLLLKELKAEHERWQVDIKTEVDEALQRQVKMGLESYEESIHEAIEKATESVENRFDTLYNIMLTGNADGSGPSLVDDWTKNEILKGRRQPRE